MVMQVNPRNWYHSIPANRARGLYHGYYSIDQNIYFLLILDENERYGIYFEFYVDPYPHNCGMSILHGYHFVMATTDTYKASQAVVKELNGDKVWKTLETLIKMAIFREHADVPYFEATAIANENPIIQRFSKLDWNFPTFDRLLDQIGHFVYEFYNPNSGNWINVYQIENPEYQFEGEDQESEP